MATIVDTAVNLSLTLLTAIADTADNPLTANTAKNPPTADTADNYC